MFSVTPPNERLAQLVKGNQYRGTTPQGINRKTQTAQLGNIFYIAYRTFSSGPKRDINCDVEAIIAPPYVRPPRALVAIVPTAVPRPSCPTTRAKASTAAISLADGCSIPGRAVRFCWAEHHECKRNATTERRRHKVEGSACTTMTKSTAARRSTYRRPVAYRMS